MSSVKNLGNKFFILGGDIEKPKEDSPKPYQYTSTPVENCKHPRVLRDRGFFDTAHMWFVAADGCFTAGDNQLSQDDRDCL